VECLEYKTFTDEETPFVKLHSGHYTKKVYYIGKRAPRFLKAVAPKSSLQLCEVSPPVLVNRVTIVII